MSTIQTRAKVNLKRRRRRLPPASNWVATSGSTETVGRVSSVY